MPEVIMQYNLDDTGKMINLVRKEEIVRCKNCEHWSRESICSEDHMKHNEDFYCGDAERIGEIFYDK